MPGWGTRSAALAAGVIASAALALGSAGAHDTGHTPFKPGGSPEALAPIPAPGKHFGFNDPSLLNNRALVPAQNVAMLARLAGADVHRYELAWKDVEPTRDQWNEHAWRVYQQVDQALARQGIRSIVVLSSTPVWARDPGSEDCRTQTGCEYPPAMANLEEWGEFAAEVARRLKRPIIETWNEANLTLFFKPQPDPQRFAWMHAVAYDAIKAARPKTTVLLGGTANSQSTDTLDGNVVRFGQRDFLTRIYPIVKDRFDGIALHPYPQHPTRRTRASLVSHAVDDARAVQARFNDLGNDLWITETGVSTSGPAKARPKQQAKGLLRSYRMLMTMADVKAVVIHTLFDQVNAPRESRGYGFGLIRRQPRFGLKPSFCAFNGRSGRHLIGDCKRQRDRRAPGSSQAKRLGKICRDWLRPQGSYRNGSRSSRARKLDRCQLDLLTIEQAKRGKVKRLRKKAAVKALEKPGGYDAAVGREGLRRSRAAVRRVAKSGYR